MGKAKKAANEIPGRRNRAGLVFILVLAAISFGVYANSLTGSFVLDDYVRWQDTSWIAGRPFPVVIHDLFAPKPGTFYRPIPYLFQVLDYYLWGPDPIGFHLTNILLHILVVILVYLVASALVTNRLVAFAIALLFAVHPVHTEAVSFIAGRTDVTMTLFFLLSFLMYVRFRRAPGPQRYGHYAASVLCFILALLSKEAAMALPLVFVAYELSLRPSHEGESTWRRLAFALAPAVVFIALYLPASILAGAGGLASINRIGVLPQTLTALRTLSGYLDLLVYPVNLSLVFDFPWSKSFFEPNALLPFLTCGAVIAAIFLTYRLSRIVSFGLSWVVLSILPISNLFAISDPPLFAERYLYLPSVGFCLALAFAICRACSVGRARVPAAKVPAGLGRANVGRTIGLLSLAGLVIAYSSLTYDRNRDWRSEYALAQKTVEQRPASAASHILLGEAYLDKGMYDAAIEEFGAALALDRENEEAYNDLGLVYEYEGGYPKAIEYFKRAVALAPKSVLARRNLGRLYCKTGEFDKAISEYRQAIAFNSGAAEAHNDLGSVYGMTGRLDDAASEYKQALAINPYIAEAHDGLAAAYLLMGKSAEAIVECEKALAINPAYTDAHVNLGSAYLVEGRTDDAIREYKRALAINPDLAQGHFSLGDAYMSRGQASEAISEYERALGIDPDLAEAHHRLAAAYYGRGNHQLALSHYDRATELGGRADPGLGELLKPYRQK